MKYLAFFLLVPLSIFSQNYHYALDQRKEVIPDTPVTPNTPDEILYFDSYFLPASRASELQEALDTYQAVRLGPGDFTRTGDIVMTSNQRLYGWVNKGTIIGGNITIKEGSNNIHIEDIDVTADFILEKGDVISGLTFKSIYFGKIRCKDCLLEDSVFINLSRVLLDWDCTNSGYFRNNRFIKVFAQANDNHVIMKGNTTTPSYGNVELSRNFLTSSLNTSEYNTLRNHTMVGTDAEGWSRSSRSGKAAYYFRNIENLKIFNITGFSDSGSPEFDIEADEVIMNRRQIGGAANPIYRANSNILSVRSIFEAPTLEANTWSLFVYPDNENIELNRNTVSNSLTGGDADRLQRLILGPQHTPWKKPELPVLPNPLGDDWKQNRTSKPDQSNLIQSLIDANGVAVLDEGIYYISKPLVIKDGQGITGQGTGKTAIVGITDDFPLILAQDNLTTRGTELTGVGYGISYLTLQGGEKGIHIDPLGKRDIKLQITDTPFKHLVFRNQVNAIHLDQFYGVDNNFFDNVNFIDCEIGLFQDPGPRTSDGEYPGNMYVDKTVFHESQYINCDVAFHMRAERPNNLDAWVDCVFDGNRIAIDHKWNNSTYLANSIFKNHTGSGIVVGGGATTSFYSCDFSDNKTSYVFDKFEIHAEGCNFMDDIDLMPPGERAFLWNNVITSNINELGNAILVNNKIENNSDLSKLMIEIKNQTPFTILDAPSNPYPQLLVRQNN